MVRERDDGGTDAEYHGGMDLAVSEVDVVDPLPLQVLKAHSNHSCFFFFHVHELD